MGSEWQGYKYQNLDGCKQNTAFSLLFKYVLVGDSGVGKSCLLRQFTHGRFDSMQDSTIGVDFGHRMITVQQKAVKLQIWDTAGQENFRSIVKCYYRGAAAALLVYDVTKRQTFEHLETWYRELCTQTQGHDILVAVVANKCEQGIVGEVTRKQGQDWAQDRGLLFFETSAKSGQGVSEAFEGIAQAICLSLERGTWRHPSSGSKGVVTATERSTAPSPQSLCCSF